jgi:signal transduction histidine kinase
VLRDISIEKMLSENSQIDKLKSMILKSFTHELKSPLNGITGFLELTHMKILEETD